MALTIKGGRVNSVAAKRMTADKYDGLAVNVEIRNVTNKDVLVVQYEYTISYNPNFAEMKIIGEAHIDGPNSERIQAQELWKKTEQLPQEAAEELLTALTYTASAVGTLLGYAVGIRAPINVPRMTLPKNAPKTSVSKSAAG